MKVIKQETKAYRIRYECEFCGFKGDEGSVREHIAQKHSFVEELELDDVPKFYRFENQEQAKLFTDRMGFSFSHSIWDGPGWYYTEEKDQRCPGGCCYDPYISIFPIRLMVDKLNSDIYKSKKLLEYLDFISDVVKGSVQQD
jgi:hypothetical protein